MGSASIMLDRLVGRDGPIGAKLGVGAMVDRRLLAHLAARLLPDIVHKHLRAGNIPRVHFSSRICEHSRHARVLSSYDSARTLPLFTLVSMRDSGALPAGQNLRQSVGLQAVRRRRKKEAGPDLSTPRRNSPADTQMVIATHKHQSSAARSAARASHRSQPARPSPRRAN